MSRRKKENQTIKKVDLSCTVDVPEGYTRVPLGTLPNDSVEEIQCSFLFNRIPANKRLEFMDEVYRVLVKGGKITITVPYWSCSRSIQDFGHEWPPIVEQSFLYFDKTWREAQKFPDAFKSDAISNWLGHSVEFYNAKCDFEFNYGYVYDAETGARSEDTKPHWVKHYINSVTDLQVVLTKK